jgi:hypothetical protein
LYRADRVIKWIHYIGLQSRPEVVESLIGNRSTGKSGTCRSQAYRVGEESQFFQSDAAFQRTLFGQSKKGLGTKCRNSQHVDGSELLSSEFHRNSIAAGSR